MKYIDADKIKAEIERLRKENNNIRCESNKAYCQGYGDAFIDLLSSLDTLEKSVSEEQPSLPDNLDEVAWQYAEQEVKTWGSTEPDDKKEVHDDFIAGANWMRKKDVEDMYLSDNRHFLKCYEQGKVDMRVEMMKDAVEGEIGYWNQRGLSIRLDKSLEKLGYDMDTKVKIVIVKEDDRPRD